MAAAAAAVVVVVDGSIVVLVVVVVVVTIALVVAITTNANSTTGLSFFRRYQYYSVAPTTARTSIVWLFHGDSHGKKWRKPMGDGGTSLAFT